MTTLLSMENCVFKKIIALVTLIGLSACTGGANGFMNDHPAPIPTPGPSVVQKIAFDYIGSFAPTRLGSYQLSISAYSDVAGKDLISPTATLANPITITSNDAQNVSFSATGSAGASSFVLNTTGDPGYLVWTPCTACSTPDAVTITMTSGTTSATYALISPPVAQRIVFDYIGNFTSVHPGSYPLAISAYSDAAGSNLIPTSAILANPISITSNDTQNISFSATGSSGTPTFSLSSTGDPGYFVWTPCPQPETPTCVTPATATITMTSGTVTGTYVLSI